MLRPCPKCGSKTLTVEERITRFTVFDVDTLTIAKIRPYTNPELHYGFRCVHCKTPIYYKNITLKEEKNYFEVIARLFRDMEHAKLKARLNYTRQSTIKESVKQ